MPTDAGSIIKHVVGSWAGTVIVAKETERVVHLFDCETNASLGTLCTIADAGGNRLAVSGDGRTIVAGAYYSDGVAAYAVTGGHELWRRRDLKRVQDIRISLDDQRVYCCFDHKACHVLDHSSGITTRTLSGVRHVWESPYADIMLVEKRTLIMQTSAGDRISSISRESFSTLCAAFATGLVCVSEAGGPLRCCQALTGKEVWRWSHPGQHVLEVGYIESDNAFVGVCTPVKPGATCQLVRWDEASGRASIVCELGPAFSFAFSRKAGLLVTSAGIIIDTATGRKLRTVVLTAPRPQLLTSMAIQGTRDARIRSGGTGTS
jgi:hypothetical protein